MKTLYISDLDGTLLNSKAEITNKSAELLNTAIDNGAFFSVATARTSSTVVKMLKDVNVNTPIVLMNGVCIYDIEKEKFVKVCTFDKKAKKEFLKILDDFSVPGFIYCQENDLTSTYYQNTSFPNAEKFIRERKEKYGKVFTKISHVSEVENKDVIYYSYSDYKEKLQPLYEKVKCIDSLRCEFYVDNYNENFWYFEVCSRDASKKNAVEFLRKEYGFEKVVGFGDNFNDIPLFEACDECYAVENAKEEVKRKAAAVIGLNTEEAVAKYIFDVNN